MEGDLKAPGDAPRCLSVALWLCGVQILYLASNLSFMIQQSLRQCTRMKSEGRDQVGGQVGCGTG